MLTEFKPGHYLAFELSDKSRANALALFTPRFSKVICHHVTIEFNLTKDNFEKYKRMLTPTPVVTAYGYAKGDGIEALAVAISGPNVENETDRVDGSFYHVTLSLDPPHKPVESNKLKDKVVLISSMFRSVASLTLAGEFKLLKK
jgi:hypothetical protein